MSFFAMYPPIFRDRKRAALNLASLDELAALLRRGGFFVGLHPEGTRNKTGDPYSLLPAQGGVGRVIHKARCPVLPVFVNGLLNDLPAQVRTGITGKGEAIHVVFGAPVDFGPLLDAPGSPKTYRRIADRCLDAIGTLAVEEKAIRQRQPERAPRRI
jgi:1-acyl-sn-glycerol-3-phosphate acyltransferase